MDKSMPEIDMYTQRYEYTCAMVNDYIARESLITAVNKSGDIFDQGSTTQWLFTTDYSAICQDEVMTQITNRLTKACDMTSRQYQMPLTRLKGTYVDICAALGADFVKTLTNNIVTALAANARQPDTVYVKFFNDWPFMILPIVGARTYTRELFRTSRLADLNSQMTNKSSTTP